MSIDVTWIEIAPGPGAALWGAIDLRPESPFTVGASATDMTGDRFGMGPYTMTEVWLHGMPVFKVESRATRESIWVRKWTHRYFIPAPEED